MRTIRAYLLIIYGIIKILLSLCELLLPVNILTKLEENPMLHNFIKSDETAAGLMISIVLFFFGIFTLFDGLNALGYLPTWLGLIFDDQMTYYWVYAIFGCFLVTFYSLVMHTSIPISKNIHNLGSYQSLGILGGYLFLIWIPIMYIYYEGLKGQLFVHMAILALVITLVAYMTFYDDVHKERIPAN